MILYKYYGFNAGLSALKSSQLGFRQPEYFNDPFELSFLNNAEGPRSKLLSWQEELNELKGNVGVLSLTRSPLNPLMWAHYGEDHSGFVIGYEVANEFLNDERHNLIPVERGDVVYTSSKMPHLVTKETKELLHDFYLHTLGLGSRNISSSDMQLLARRVFLVKHACWVYEEEVRVVKLLERFDEEAAADLDDFNSYYHLIEEVAAGQYRLLVDGLRIYNFGIKIKEVYLGLRNPLLCKPYRNDESVNGTDVALHKKAIMEGWKIYDLRMKSGSWDLIVNEGTPNSLILEGRLGPNRPIILTGEQFISCQKALKNTSAKPGDRFVISRHLGRMHVKLNDEWL